MLIFILTLALMLVVVAIMSIGVMMGRKPIAGSCGGLKALGEDVVCEICGGKAGSCEAEQRSSSPAPGRAQGEGYEKYYDADVKSASSTNAK